MDFLIKIINRVLRKADFEIKNIGAQKDYSFDLAREAKDACDLVEGKTMLSRAKLISLYEQAVFCEKNGIPGAFVECGVWKGGAVGVMAQASLKEGREVRPLFLFDSFDDICEPDPEVDGLQAIKDMEKLLGRKAPVFSGKMKPVKGIYDKRGGHGTIRECRELLVEKLGYPGSQINFCKGWFEDSLPREILKIPKIAILRIDADWYNSTKICLDYLYDKVSPGGFIIIDDYGRYNGCKKAVQDFFKERKIQPYLHYADTLHGECRYFIKSSSG